MDNRSTEVRQSRQLMEGRLRLTPNLRQSSSLPCLTDSTSHCSGNPNDENYVDISVEECFRTESDSSATRKKMLTKSSHSSRRRRKERRSSDPNAQHTGFSTISKRSFPSSKLEELEEAVKGDKRIALRSKHDKILRRYESEGEGSIYPVYENTQTSLLRRFRTWCGLLVEAPKVQIAVIWLMIANALFLGIATFDFVTENDDVQTTFQIVDRTFLAIFTVESGLQLVFRGLSLFSDTWLCLDFMIVAASWSFEVVQLLRSVRIFRLFRVIARVGPLRELINALADVMPRMNAIFIMLLLFFYVFAVLFTELFGDLELSTNYFGSLNQSLFTCMELMTLEWSSIVREVMEQKPWAWLPFLSFISFSGFIVFNLIVAVVCDAVSIADRQGKDEDAAKEVGQQGFPEEMADDENIQIQVSKLSAQLSGMKDFQKSMADAAVRLTRECDFQQQEILRLRELNRQLTDSKNNENIGRTSFTSCQKGEEQEDRIPAGIDPSGSVDPFSNNYSASSSLDEALAIAGLLTSAIEESRMLYTDGGATGMELLASLTAILEQAWAPGHRCCSPRTSSLPGYFRREEETITFESADCVVERQRDITLRIDDYDESVLPGDALALALGIGAATEKPDDPVGYSSLFRRFGEATRSDIMQSENDCPGNHVWLHGGTTPGITVQSEHDTPIACSSLFVEAKHRRIIRSEHDAVEYSSLYGQTDQWTDDSTFDHSSRFGGATTHRSIVQSADDSAVDYSSICREASHRSIIQLTDDSSADYSSLFGGAEHRGILQTEGGSNVDCPSLLPSLFGPSETPSLKNHPYSSFSAEVHDQRNEDNDKASQDSDSL